MNEEKLKHQLFIGKVSDVIGMKKTIELLKEVREAIKNKIMSEKKEVSPCCKADFKEPEKI